MNTFLLGAVGATLFWAIFIFLIAVWNSAVAAKARDLIDEQRTKEVEAGKRLAREKSI